MNKRGHIKLANSASCGDFSQSRKARFLDEPFVLSSSLALHDCKNSSTILEFASCVEGAESSEKFKSKKPFKSFCYFWLSPKVESPLSFNYNLPSKVDSQNLQGGLPRRFCESARNDEFLDYSLRLRFAQNDKNSARVAESTLDSADFATNAESANKSQQTIEEIAVEVAEFLGDFECKTGLESAQCSKSPKSPQDAPKTKLKTRDELT